MRERNEPMAQLIVEHEAQLMGKQACLMSAPALDAGGLK